MADSDADRHQWNNEIVSLRVSDTRGVVFEAHGGDAKSRRQAVDGDSESSVGICKRTVRASDYGYGGTMKNTEVAGWVRSLQLRSVELPDELKDEVFMIVAERRSDGHKRGE